MTWRFVHAKRNKEKEKQKGQTKKRIYLEVGVIGGGLFFEKTDNVFPFFIFLSSFHWKKIFSFDKRKRKRQSKSCLYSWIGTLWFFFAEIFSSAICLLWCLKWSIRGIRKWKKPLGFKLSSFFLCLFWCFFCSKENTPWTNVEEWCKIQRLEW